MICLKLDRLKATHNSGHMNWMRRTRRWTWAVLAWMGLSLSAATLAPLMAQAGPMQVCSASRSAQSGADASGARVAHGWQCAQCLPFMATAPSAAPWSSEAPKHAPLPTIRFVSWVQPLVLPYAARGPPLA